MGDAGGLCEASQNVGIDGNRHVTGHGHPGPGPAQAGGRQHAGERAFVVGGQATAETEQGLLRHGRDQEGKGPHQALRSGWLARRLACQRAGRRALASDRLALGVGIDLHLVEERLAQALGAPLDRQRRALP